MRLFRLSFIFVFLFALSVLAFAQTQAKFVESWDDFPKNLESSQKIAVVNTSYFEDEKKGILLYLKVLDEIRLEFKQFDDELNLDADNINKHGEEIRLLAKHCAISCPLEKIKLKLVEHEKLVLAYKQKIEPIKARYQQRVNDGLKQIKESIRKELIEFATKGGFTLVIDVSKVNNLLLCFIKPDITKEFIAYYNAKHPVTNSQTQVKLSEPR